jgi:hypothetical protein
VSPLYTHSRTRHVIIYSILQISVNMCERGAGDEPSLPSSSFSSPPSNDGYTSNDYEKTWRTRRQPYSFAIRQLLVFHHFVRMLLVLVHFLGRFPGRRSVRPGHPLGCRRRRHFDHRTANVGPAQHRRRGRCRLRREVVLALVGGATHLEDDLHVVRGAAPPYSPMQVVLRRRR